MSIKLPVRWSARDEAVMDANSKVIAIVHRHIGMTTSRVNEVGTDMVRLINRPEAVSVGVKR